MKLKKNRRYIIWMAWRYLRTKKQRGGLSFMTIVSILGVAIGVAALIIVLSVMGGFETDLKSKFLTGQPHMEIYSDIAGGGFSLNEVTPQTVSNRLSGVLAVEPFTKSDVVLKKRKHLASATLFGVKTGRDQSLWAFDQKLTEGSFEDLEKDHLSVASDWGDDSRYPGIILGEELAMQLSADIGDEVTLLSPQAHIGGVLEGGTFTRHYVVVGKFKANSSTYDGKWAVVSLSEGRHFMADYDPTFQKDEMVTGLAIKLKDPFHLEKARADLRSIPNTQVSDWQSENKSLLFALKLEKVTMGSILMLIVVVAAFSISGTMMMTVFHKRNQISLLRSIGMNQKEISRLFLLHGVFIGSVGITLGLLVGVGVCYVIQIFPVISLPKGVYYLKYLPVRFLPLDYLVICCSAWFLSLVASAYPALTASRQNPTAALR